MRQAICPEYYTAGQGQRVSFKVARFRYSERCKGIDLVF